MGSRFHRFRRKLVEIATLENLLVVFNWIVVTDLGNIRNYEISGSLSHRHTRCILY